jgi:rubrerythrin
MFPPAQRYPSEKERTMTREEALRTAMEYEVRIRDIYREAAEGASDPIGARVFSSLAEDEQRHVDYLESRLEQWRRTGKIRVERIDSVIPDINAIQRRASSVSREISREDRRDEKQMLSKALQAEIETSRFYQKLVDTLADEGRALFARFLEIEQGHIEAVQAEMDYLTKTGYWLDFKEFDME